MKPINTNKEYQEYVKQKSPNSPIFKNCFNSFWVGGLICALGQIIMEICKYRGLDIEMSGTVVSISLIFLSAFLTSLNIFNKIGKFAGAGSLVPITGFANSIVSPSISLTKEITSPPFEIPQSLHIFLLGFIEKDGVLSFSLSRPHQFSPFAFKTIP